jgi:hypothetical protein
VAFARHLKLKGREAVSNMKDSIICGVSVARQEQVEGIIWSGPVSPSPFQDAGSLCAPRCSGDRQREYNTLQATRRQQILCLPVQHATTNTGHQLVAP